MKSYTFKCPKCSNAVKSDIYFQYEIILIDYSKKEYYITQADKFQFLPPKQLYQNIKNYFISENIIKLDINNIILLEKKINVFLITLLFSLKTLNIDFLFPYIKPKTTSITELFGKTKEKEKELSIFGCKVKEPISIGGNSADIHIVFRKFNVIKPIFSPPPKKRKSFSFSI